MASPPTLDKNLPKPLGAVIRGCLRQDPARRWTAEQCLQHLDPTATPLHDEPEVERGDCFLCAPGNDCARPQFIGQLGDVRQTSAGYVCTLFASDQLEPTPLLLAESWADLGARLVAAWPQLATRERGVMVSAFHVFAHEAGYRAGDASLVVLDPDWLVNVTDLSYVSNCERIQLARRYKANRASAPITTGHVVHSLFPKIWNHELHHAYPDEREAALRKHVQSLAQARERDVDVAGLRDKIDSHVERLQTWANKQSRNTVLNTESYVIAPRLGLKGRIDALWFKEGQPIILGELKTGSRKDNDVLQLVSYGLMLVSRDEAQRDIYSALIYSKDAPVQQMVRLDHAQFRRAVDLRNRVLLLDYTMDAPYNEPHCVQCWQDDRRACAILSTLRGHRDLRAPKWVRAYASDVEHLGPSELEFYRRHEAELLAELRAVKAQAAWLWSRSCEEREQEGLAMRFTTVLPDGQSDGGHRYSLVAGKGANHSNFKPEDRVILSGVEGPVKGRLATARVVEAHADGLVVRSDAPVSLETDG